MRKPLEELYFEWLYHQVGSRKMRKTYWNILRLLHSKEYVWLIANDDNRALDGIDLRYEFQNDLHIDADHDWLILGCSMLEMLIGLARRLSFETDREPRAWFWHLISILDLNYTDADEIPLEKVDDILNRVIFRTYEPNGEGGLFPLKHTDVDQRDIELWYQLCAYVMERAF